MNESEQTLEKLNIYLDNNYINNTNIIKAEKSGQIYNKDDTIIINILNNVAHGIDSLETLIKKSNKEVTNLRFRILNSDILNICNSDSIAYIKLLQVLDNYEILGYLQLSQQYKFNSTFNMGIINEYSDTITKQLCNLYTEKYQIKGIQKESVIL